MRSSYWRSPYPPEQRERAIEERLAAHFAGLSDTVSVHRQVRFPDGTRADLIVEAELPELPGPTRLFTVVEVKAGRAGWRALRQLNGYLVNLRAILYASGMRNWMLAGALAAPRFQPSIEEYAARCAYDETLFTIWRVEP